MLWPGNCLCGVVLLWLLKGGSIFTFNRPSRGPRMPHFLLRTKTGEVWHFKLVHDILPWPFSWVLFLGKFEQKK